MDARLVSDYGHLFYDPYILGYKEDFFIQTNKSSGSARSVSGKIRMTADAGGAIRLNSQPMIMFGNNIMDIDIPTAPTSGDSRIWGYYSRAYGSRNAAYFYISGTSFYARTYSNDSATAESTTIPWVSSWTNTRTRWEIRWKIDRVEFYADGIKLATHCTRIPKQTLLPMYWYNNQVDNMDLYYIEIRQARKIVDYSV